MQNIITLFKVLSKNTAMKMPGKDNKRTMYKSFGIIALSCIMIPCCLIVGYVSYIIAKALNIAGSPTAGLLAEVHIMSAFSMVFGILVIFSVLFFSSDREHLVPLPFKPYEILTAKFAYSFLAESVMEFLVLISMFVGYFTAVNSNIISIIAAAIGVIFIPLLPLIYCVILCLIIMMLLKNVKNSRIFDYISTIFMWIFIGLFLLSFKDMGSINMDNYVSSLANNSNSFFNVLNKIFFTVPILLKAIEHGSILNLLLYIIANIAALLIMIFIGAFAYQPGLFTVARLGGKGRTHKVKNSDVKCLSPTISYIKKELRVLFRTKAYRANCVLINLLWPFGLGLFLYLNNGKSNMIRIITMYDKGYERARILVLLAVIGFSFVACAMNSLASTAFTREGAHLALIKYIPVEYETQVWIKGAISLLLTYPALLASIIIWCIYAHSGVLAFLLYCSVSLLCVLITTALGLYLDSVHPHSTWDDEYSALRGNLNNFFDMALVMVISVIVGGLPFIAYTLGIIGYNMFAFIVMLLLSFATLFALLLAPNAITRNIENL